MLHLNVENICLLAFALTLEVLFDTLLVWCMLVVGLIDEMKN